MENVKGIYFVDDWWNEDCRVYWGVTEENSNEISLCQAKQYLKVDGIDFYEFKESNWHKCKASDPFPNIKDYIEDCMPQEVKDYLYSVRFDSLEKIEEAWNLGYIEKRGDNNSLRILDILYEKTRFKIIKKPQTSIPISLRTKVRKEHVKCFNSLQEAEDFRKYSLLKVKEEKEKLRGIDFNEDIDNLCSKFPELKPIEFFMRSQPYEEGFEWRYYEGSLFYKQSFREDSHVIWRKEE